MRHIERLFLLLRVALFSAVGCAISAQSASGAIIASEPFAYTGTTLNGQSGGSGFSGAWVASATLSPGSYGTAGPIALSNDNTSLSFPSISGSGARISNPATNGTATRALTTPIDLTSNSTYYVSALVRGAGLIQFQNASFTRVTLGIVSDATLTRFTAAGDVVANKAEGTTYNGGTAYNANTVYLLVGKIVASSTVSDTISLKVYDPTMVVPSSDPATFDYSTSVTSGQSLSSISVATFATSAGNEIDAIRIGTSWIDVVPEPGSSVICAMAFCGLLARRKSRSSR